MKKILVLEDDPVVAHIYRNKLLNSGFAVDVAHDGESGLRLLQSEPPDLLLLDLGLPRLTGVEVLKRLRATPGLTNLPVVVLSNSYVTDMVQAAWKAGANRCLTKATCTPTELVEIIGSLFAAPRSQGPAEPERAQPSAASAELAAERTDVMSQAQIRQTFISSGPNLLVDLRRRFQNFAQAAGEARPLSDIIEFYRTVHSITGNAGVAGLVKIATLSAALEALLKELYEKPKNFGPSPIRTIAAAIDTLADLFKVAGVTSSDEALPPLALIVDDDILSRKTITLALEKARLRAIALEDPKVALKCLEQNTFDLIFSDISMPEINGLEFCAKVRELPAHKNTPVVFVTSHTDFETKAASRLSGGTDLIAKPFLLVELAVKALTLLQQRR
jgi:DNA-binding response OmpR family regulator